MRRYMMQLLLVIFLMFPLSGYAGMPLDTVQTHVNSVLDILRDPSFKGDAARKAKIEKIRLISNDMFDYMELSRRTLARNWIKFDSDQRAEFIDLYRKILEDAYIDKIFDYKDEKVVFHREKIVTEKKAEVHTNIITESVEIPMNYKLILKNGTWKVYDVIIEGVSLLGNYRSQFKKILMNKKPEKLLETLRKKAAKTLIHDQRVKEQEET